MPLAHFLNSPEKMSVMDVMHLGSLTRISLPYNRADNEGNVHSRARLHGIVLHEEGARRSFKGCTDVGVECHDGAQGMMGVLHHPGRYGNWLVAMVFTLILGLEGRFGHKHNL